MNLSPLPIQKFFDNNGEPLVRGRLFTYVSGTTTKLATYTDSSGGTPNTNPVVLDYRGEANIWLDQTLTYKFVLAPPGSDDPPTQSIWTVDNVSAAVTYASLTLQILGQILWPRQPNEIAAGVTPTNYGVAYANWVNAQRYGIVADAVTNDTTAFTAALNVADETIFSAQGNALDIAQGTCILSATLNIPNRVSIRGRNKRGSILKADALHSGTYMLTVDNGIGSTFDNSLRDLTLDCNNVAGMGGVLSDAWQEGGGLRDVLIQNFRTYGVRFRNGDGGAAVCAIKDSEIFGASSAANAGIYVDSTVSAVSAFRLLVESTTIAGGSIANLPRGIHMDGGSLTAIDVHFEVLGSGIYLDGSGNHVLINCHGASGGSTITTLIELAATFSGSVTILGCVRNGATNFLVDNRAGGYGTISGFDPPRLTIAAAGVIPDTSVGGNWVSGWFDGTPAGPALTLAAGYNTASITKNGVGDYRVAYTRALTSVNNGVPFACSNLANSTIETRLVGASSFDIRIRVAGVLTDSQEIKYGVVRVA